MKEKICLIIVFIAIFILFAFLAKIDYLLIVKPGREQTYDLKIIRVGGHIFWLWVVGYPCFAVLFSILYFAGSRNIWYSLGILLTIFLLAFGQLEDYLFHVLNGVPFPESDWSCYGWRTDNNIYYWIFGIWTTRMHFILLTASIIVTIIMWGYIFKKKG